MADSLDLPIRKPNRLPFYDYSSIGLYFITVCTKDRKRLFWHDNVGAGIARPLGELSPYGVILEQAIYAIPHHYPTVSVERYVIMPDHVHLLLCISDKDGRAMPAPTISTVIQQLKGYVTKQIGMPIWQKRFYDHVVRCHEDLEEIVTYIENNPAKWLEKQMAIAKLQP